MKPYQLFVVAPAEPSPLRPHSVGFPRARGGLSLLLLAFCLATAFLSPAFAADGALDPSFIANPGVQWGLPEIRGQVNYNTGGTLNGYSLLFGSFYSLTEGSDFQQYSSIARLNSTGHLDTNFMNAQIPGEIRCVYIYPHTDPLYPDKILIGGDFAIFTPTASYKRLARLNANGTLDPDFASSFSGEGAVNTIGVVGSGDTAQILVGGCGLRPADDTPGPGYHLARLNHNGDLDTSYTPWTAPGGYISDIRVNSPLFPGNVLIFCSYPKNPDGSGGNYYVLLFDYGVNLSSPLAFLGDETVDGPILNMARQSNGNYMICGQFQNAYNSATGWVPRNRVARFGADMSLDAAYNVVGVGPDGRVTQISPMSPTDDRMVLAGDFSTWNGAPCGYLLCLTDQGAVDPGFTTGARADDRIMRLNWFSNGTGGLIYGYFRSYSGQTRGGIAGINADGSPNESYPHVTANGGGSGDVKAMAVQSDGKIIIGGSFSGVGGKYRGNLARLNPNGSLDPSFKGDVDGWVQSVALQADGKILVAGCFGLCQGYTCDSLARLNPDGSLDATFMAKLGAGFDNGWSVNQVVPLANGQIMAAGDIKALPDYNQVPAVRLNSNGSRDPGFDASGFTIPGATWWSGKRLAVVGLNYLIAGNYDTDPEGGGGYLARFTPNGAVDTSFGPDTPAPHIQTTDGGIFDLLLQPDGKIVVSGGFTHILDGSVSPPACRAMARFTASGLLDSSFTPNITLPFGATSIVIDAMARQPNGKILFYGNSFNNTDNYVGAQVARLNADGSSDSSFAPGNPTNGYAWPGGGQNSILRLPNGKALIGGNFSKYNGTPAWSLVRVFAGPANFDPSVLYLLLEN